MPKRKSIYDEDPLQSKIHVGEKEVNLGVNSEMNMRKVYEKTRQLLFNGAANRKIAENGNANAHLEQNGFHENNRSKGQGITNGLNGHCSSQNMIACVFCEKCTVASNCRTCSICFLSYCHLCSILQYGSQEETAVCLSCLQ